MQIVDDNQGLSVGLLKSHGLTVWPFSPSSWVHSNRGCGVASRLEPKKLHRRTFDKERQTVLTAHHLVPAREHVRSNRAVPGLERKSPYQRAAAFAIQPQNFVARASARVLRTTAFRIVSFIPRSSIGSNSSLPAMIENWVPNR